MTEVIAKAINDDLRNRYSGVSQALNFTIAAILAHRGEKDKVPTMVWNVKECYSVPYRCLRRAKT